MGAEPDGQTTGITGRRPHVVASPRRSRAGGARHVAAPRPHDASQPRPESRARPVPCPLRLANGRRRAESSWISCRRQFCLNKHHVVSSSQGKLELAFASAPPWLVVVAASCPRTNGRTARPGSDRAARTHHHSKDTSSTCGVLAYYDPIRSKTGGSPARRLDRLPAVAGSAADPLDWSARRGLSPPVT